MLPFNVGQQAFKDTDCAIIHAKISPGVMGMRVRLLFKDRPTDGRLSGRERLLFAFTSEPIPPMRREHPSQTPPSSHLPNFTTSFAPMNLDASLAL